MDDYSKEDAAYKQGIKTEDYGKCDYAISFPDIGYEVGLVKQPDNSYTVVYDFFDNKLKQKMGGEDAGAFMQAYAIERARIEARKQNLSFKEETMTDGSIKVSVGVR